MKKQQRESVWDYPRPPGLEKVSRKLKVIAHGKVVAETDRGFRIVETSHPPVYYFPPQDVRQEFLNRNQSRTFCEWKGAAAYYDLVLDDHKVHDAAWSYLKPNIDYYPIKGYFAFYPGKMDECFVDDEKVQAQEGDFYGGWITSNIEGPFKGMPGTWKW